METRPNCRPDLVCPCPYIARACAGLRVAETPTHHAVITDDLTKVWIEKEVPPALP